MATEECFCIIKTQSLRKNQSIKMYQVQWEPKVECKVPCGPNFCHSWKSCLPYVVHGEQNSTGLGCWNRALRLLNMFPSTSSEYTHPWSLQLASIIMGQNMILVFFFIQIPTLIIFIGFFFSLVSLHLYPRCTTGIQSLPSHQKSHQALFFPYLNINRG